MSLRMLSMIVGMDTPIYQEGREKPRALLSPRSGDGNYLEVELRPELDQPAGIDRRDLAKTRALDVIVDARERARSVAELRVVEHVVTLESQLQILRFV